MHKLWDTIINNMYSSNQDILRKFLLLSISKLSTTLGA